MGYEDLDLVKVWIVIFNTPNDCKVIDRGLAAAMYPCDTDSVSGKYGRGRIGSHHAFGSKS